MFEKASRLKLRFRVSNGVVTAEELWDMSLESLDSVAKAIYKGIKESEEISFLKTKVKNERIELQFEIIKHVILTRLAEQEAAKARAANRERQALILNILHTKQNDALLNKSEEELLKELESISGE